MSNKKLYMKIYEHMMTDILNGKYVLNEKLPSLPTLCEEYQVGRNTMRSAMLLLEERGFIKNQRGKKAVVSFDINEMESQKMYQTSIYERKLAYQDIYELLGDFMPELVAEIKAKTGKEQLDELINKVNDLYSDDNKIHSPKELADTIYGITAEAVSYLNNSLLDSLYLAILHFIFLPMPTEVNQSKRLSKTVKLVGESIPRIASFLLARNDLFLKKSISLLMNSFSKNSIHYIEKLENILGSASKEIEFIQFEWSSKRNLDLRYMNTVILIIQDINNHRYTTSLPSLNQLSENYNVSLRTIRKACDVLADYRIIQKNNGLRSKIVVKDIHNPKILFRNKEILNKVIQYKESLQILIIMSKGLCKPVLSKLDKEEIEALINSFNDISKDILSDFIRFLFMKSNSAYITIYNELNKSLAWNIYTDIIFDQNKIHFDFQSKSDEFIEAIHKRQYDEIHLYLDQIYAIVEYDIDLIIDKYHS